VNQLSSEKIFLDMHEELIGLHRVLKGDRLLAILPQEDGLEAVRARLQALLELAWTPQWLKAKPSKPRPQQSKAKQSGAHTSVHKCLEEARLQSQNGPFGNLNC
jgi:hypothetical protein